MMISENEKVLHKKEASPFITPGGIEKYTNVN